MKKLKTVGLLIGLALTFYLGTHFGGESPSSAPQQHATETPGESVTEDVIWTCSMHPHIRMKEPGLCPVCAMDLIAQETHSSTGSDRQLIMNAWDKKRAQIMTTPVERKFVDMPVRMVGKLVYDETQVKTISSWVDGRVDRLYVDYTGISVNQGDHLVELYSPDLLTGQEELIEAKRRVETGAQQKSEFLRNSDRRSLESAREKLRLWGLSKSQINAIESGQSSSERILITSPQSGIVIHKALSEGDYIKTGSHIYTVADLASLWVKLDAYESDLQWLHYGQDVAIETEAYPGETFHGVISFIDPMLDEKTRTVKVRVNVDNETQRLKPGMFVRATVHAQLAQGGKVMDPKLAGKWIGPMHPEVIRDEAGDCPICKMPLVKAETLGYVSADAHTYAPLVVPATAVLRTGRRALVYVEVDNSLDNSIYEGREVVLGARAGDYYLVREGLREGEVVVTHGNFNIDSALQIKAKPSMMSMDEDPHPKSEGDAYVTIRTALAPMYSVYFDLVGALSQDDLRATQIEASRLFKLASELDTTLSGVVIPSFIEKGEVVYEEEFLIAIQSMVDAKEIGEARIAFTKVSLAILMSEKGIGHTGKTPFYEAYCSMAFDGEGGTWLQDTKNITNPFYGSDMLSCGTIENTFAGH